MSYLDYPRIHFTGKFQATPSTLNNTPNNYARSAFQDGLQTAPREVYWNPNGNGVFNLIDCVVSKVVYGPGNATTDPDVEPVIGQPVSAVYGKAPPKIVDLDPDQQNVSEIWGLTLQVAGLGPNTNAIPNFLRGDFTETCYHNIWAQSQHGPQSSARGAGAYQSLLTSVSYDSTSAAGSKCLELLAKQSPQYLSVLFTVNAHNNAPPNYSFNRDTFEKMNDKGIPVSVTDKIKPLKDIIQNVGDTPGDIPTQSYVNYLLGRYLSEAEVTQYEPRILTTTAQPYKSEDMPTDFTFGFVTGSIGPQQTPSPTHITAGARMLVPVKPSNNAPACNYAPFKTTTNGDTTRISVDFSNAIPTSSPGFEPVAELTNLKLGYFDQSAQPGIQESNFVAIADVDLASGSLVQYSGGVFDVTVTGQFIDTNPLGIVTPGTARAGMRIWLAEQSQGYYVSADKFVHRLNPARAVGGHTAPAVTAQVEFFATKFGASAPNLSIELAMMSPEEAINYTLQTMGTGNTKGIENLSTPPKALKFYSVDGNEVTRITTNADGVATLVLKATDPGTPRAEQNLNGQIYFVKYKPDPNVVVAYEQSADSILSVQVYTAEQVPESPTWKNFVGDVLPQYGNLYPVMGSLQLWDYQSVYANREMIKTVLSKPIQDALHMPVIRDMSDARRQTIINWIEAGAPE